MRDIGRREAEEALATIQHEREAAADRFSETGWRQPVTAAVMGAATAALAVPGTVVVVVSCVVYLGGLVSVFGTPARLGMVPQEDRGSIAQVFLGGIPLLAIFSAGLTGQQLGLWWLAVLAGLAAAAATVMVMRWRRTAIRRALLRSGHR